MKTLTRELLLRLCSAAWGFAIGIALLPIWLRPAPPGQPPGYMTSLGLDGRASFRFVIGLMLLPLLVTFLTRRATAILARDDTRAWARNLFCGAAILALWYQINERSWIVAVFVPLIGLIAAILLRRFDARFHRRDMILVPTYAAVWVALLDLMPKSVQTVTLTAVAIVVAARLVARNPIYFSLSPLALIFQTHFFGYSQRHNPWPPLILALVAPFLLRFFVRDSERARKRLRIAAALVVYPLAAYAYLSAVSLHQAEGMPHADLFEDSHHLLAASEMLRGETLYRDTIPSHGMIHDGLLPYAALRTGPVDLGRALEVRGLIGAMNVIGNYALAAAATGSPEVGIAAVFLGMMLGTAAGTARVLPALLTLAIIAAALRRRDPRLLLVAGAGVVVSILMSLDFGAFALIVILIAAWRMRAFKHMIIGGAGATVVLFVVLAIFGIAGDFVRVTLFEIATLAPAYAAPPFSAPQALDEIRNIPEVLAGLFDKTAYLYVVWVLVALGVSAALLRPRRENESPRRRARDEAILIIAVFMLVTGISYAERHHLYWQFALAPLAAVLIFRLSRSCFAHLTPLAVLAALMAAQPTMHLAIAAGLRRAHGLVYPGWRELGVPRAQNALINDRDAAVIDTVKRYAGRRLGEGETFFDFSNRALLYFLLDRDCPIRQPEVAFYQSEELQREVIARIERNPRVRFALVSATVDAASVDGIANSTRAPLVWQYIQQHFALDHEEGGLQFWLRR